MFKILIYFLICSIRAVLVFYYLGVIIPNFIYFYIETWYLNANNWWISKDEPFFTNESIFNALICWFIWSYIIFILQIMIYIYLPILGIICIFFLVVYI